MNYVVFLRVYFSALLIAEFDSKKKRFIGGNKYLFVFAPVTWKHLRRLLNIRLTSLRIFTVWLDMIMHSTWGTRSWDETAGFTRCFLSPSGVRLRYLFFSSKLLLSLRYFCPLYRCSFSSDWFFVEGLGLFGLSNKSSFLKMRLPFCTHLRISPFVIRLYFLKWSIFSSVFRNTLPSIVQIANTGNKYLIEEKLPSA